MRNTSQSTYPNVFTKQSHGGVLLHRAGRVLQTGRYSCVVHYAGNDETIHIYIGKKLALHATLC